MGRWVGRDALRTNDGMEGRKRCQTQESYIDERERENERCNKQED